MRRRRFAPRLPTPEKEFVPKPDGAPLGPGNVEVLEGGFTQRRKVRKGHIEAKLCHHRLRRDSISSAPREPGIESLIGENAVTALQQFLHLHAGSINLGFSDPDPALLIVGNRPSLMTFRSSGSCDACLARASGSAIAKNPIR
jgi:hypothetical protein